MIGTIIYKDNFNTRQYAQCAGWCNETQLATIEDKGEYYECVAIPQPSDDEKLEKAKEDKIAELKQARDIAELEPINNFDVDEKSLMRINNAITVLNITNKTTEWTLADNTLQEVSAQDLTMVILALAQQSDMVHNKYRLLKEQVVACESIEDVNSIIWSLD